MLGQRAARLNSPARALLSAFGAPDLNSSRARPGAAIRPAFFTLLYKMLRLGGLTGPGSNLASVTRTQGPAPQAYGGGLVP